MGDPLRCCYNYIEELQATENHFVEDPSRGATSKHNDLDDENHNDNDVEEALNKVIR